MIVEKTLIVLSGKANAVVKITKSSGVSTLELSAPTLDGECRVLVREGGVSEVYSLSLSGGKDKVVIDEINPSKADFCLFVGDEPIAVGTCRKNKPSLTDFSLPRALAQENATTVTTEPELTIQEITATDEVVKSEENTVISEQIEYNDEQIAVENYYENDESGQIKQSEKSIRNYETPVEQFSEIKTNSVEKITGRKATYYEKVSEEIDKFFALGKREETLEKALPFTKWVKVENGEMAGCVVGLIGEKPDYICYGLPGKYEPIAPDELEKFCQWLPLDVKNPQGEGYWLIYQNATTGKTVPFEGNND